MGGSLPPKTGLQETLIHSSGMCNAWSVWFDTASGTSATPGEAIKVEFLTPFAY